MTKKDQKRRKGEKRNIDQRKELHFGDQDLWNFFIANAKAQVSALTRLRDSAYGYPGDLDSMDDWHVLLNQMIDGFQAIIDYDEHWLDDGVDWHALWDESEQRFNTGMTTYTKWYRHLWD